MSTPKEIVIPFSGFYESLHASAIDNAIEQLFSDDSGDANTGLSNRLYNQCDFSTVRREYAKDYAKQFATEFELPSLTFKLLSSPREYNFTTDRIICEVSDDDIDKMLAKTPAEVFKKHAVKTFTSRDGFHSFYSPDIADWRALAEWDHNQLGCLLEAYVEHTAQTDFDQYAESALMEDANCNGDIDNWITNNTDGIERLYKVHDYLRTRNERKEHRHV